MDVFDVFISYRRSDGTELAQLIYNYLTKKGLRVFLDQEKMVDGKYFTSQIIEKLKQAPNYLLIATRDVFRFREDTDWVREEIALALSEYETYPGDRTVNVVVPAGTDFPDSSQLPEEIRNITIPNRILLAKKAPDIQEYFRILKAVTGVNYRNLWNAGHRWLSANTRRGARFEMLNIDETIMPKAKRVIKRKKSIQMPIRVSQKDQDGCEPQREEQLLLDALRMTQGHLYLIGEGGIGKTTALVHIMKNAYQGKRYSDSKQIPLFLELSHALDTYGAHYSGGVSTFIRRMIYQQIRSGMLTKKNAEKQIRIEDAYSADPEIAVEPINELLMEDVSSPRFLLLLDGLNEISRTEVEEVGQSVVQMITREIVWIIEKCPNVRVIITSRTDETGLHLNDVTRLHLSGIDDSTIYRYLNACGLSTQRLSGVFSNPGLLETLRIPLFLTLYATLEGSDEVTSRGGILRVFFSERAEYLKAYTVQKRIAETNENVVQSSGKSNTKRIHARMQSFMLDFLLPELAWNMERIGSFYVDIEEVAAALESVLTENGEGAICGRFGKRLFTKYRSPSDSGMHTLRVAKEIMSKLGDDFDERAEAIVNCCMFQLGVLRESNGQFGFVHHHIRDYFAAIKVVNTLRLAVFAHEQGSKELACECISLIKDRPLNVEVRKFVGEYLGEDKNAPKLVDGSWRYIAPTECCDRSLIQRALDIFRGRFDRTDGYAVYSLVEILKDVRKNLSGFDFSRLDLSQCVLNRVDLGEHGGPACFNGAKLRSETLFPAGHSHNIYSAVFSSDGKFILTASTDCTARIWDAKNGVLIKVFSGHTKGLRNAVFSPDNKQIVTASWDGTANIWDSQTGALIHTLNGHLDEVECAKYSSDQRKIVTASRDRTVKIWDAQTGALLRTISGHVDKINSVSFSPDNLRIVTASDDHTAKIWDTETGMLVHTIEGHKHAVFYAAYSPNGEYVATTSFKDTLKIWNAKNGDLVSCLGDKISSGSIIAFDSSGRRILSSSDYDMYTTLNIWDAKTGILLREINAHTNEITGAQFSPDGCRIVTSSVDQTVKMWDAQTGMLLYTIEGSTNNITSAAYSPHGTKLLFSSDDKTAKIINAHTGVLIGTLDGHTELVNKAAYSPDGKRIVTIADDFTVKIWDADCGILRHTLTGHTSFIHAMALSPDGEYLVTGGWDHTAKIWNTRTGMLIHSLKDYYHDVDVVTFSADGEQILTGSHDGKARIWNRESGKLIHEFSWRGNSVNAAAFSPDGKLAVVCFWYGMVQVWDAQQWKMLRILDGHRRTVSAVAFSPDSRRIVTGSFDKTGKVWDAKTGDLIATLKGHADDIEDVSFSPDGRLVLTSSSTGLKRDLSAKIWDAESGLLLHTLDGHTDLIKSMVFSPDGSRIMTSSHDGTVQIWDVATGKRIDMITNVPGLRLVNCDLRYLHPESVFSDEEKDILRRYGAILD